MRHRLDTAPNFRDLGGLPTTTGGELRRGLIYRSEALLHPDDADAAVLSSLGIRLVCDLRSDTERDHAPNAWWAAREIERLDLDVLAGIRTADGPWSRLKEKPDADGAEAAMAAIYAAMPAAAAPHLATILRRIAAGDVPMLIHCTAGKDRTGFVSAILLSLLGVDREAIVADYLDSAGRRTNQVREHTRKMATDRVGPHVTEEALDALMGVERRYVETSFAVIDDVYGSVENYADFAGFPRERLVEVRSRILA